MLIINYIRLRSEQPYDIVNKPRLSSAKLCTAWASYWLAISYTVMQRQLTTLYCAKGGVEIIMENPPTNPLKNHNMKSWTPPFTGGQGTTSIRTSFCVRICPSLHLSNLCVSLPSPSHHRAFLCPPPLCLYVSFSPCAFLYPPSPLCVSVPSFSSCVFLCPTPP